MEFCEFLRWLRGEGINIVVGLVIPFLLEIWPWFKDQVGIAKSVISMSIFLIIPTLSAVFGAASSCHSWAFDEVFWPALVAGFLAYWASQASYNFVVKKLMRKNAQ